MKKTITLLLLMLSVYSFAQNTKSSTTVTSEVQQLKERIDEQDKIIRELQKNDITIHSQKENLESIKVLVDKSREREDRFISWLNLCLIAVTVVISVAAILGYKSIHDVKKLATDRLENLSLSSENRITASFTAYENKIAEIEKNVLANFKEIISKKVKEQTEYIINVIESEVWLSDLRKTTNMLVLNKAGSKINTDVQNILDLTELKYSVSNINNFSDIGLENLRNQGINAVFIEHANSGSDETWDNMILTESLAVFSQEVVNNGIAVFYFNSADKQSNLFRFPTLDNNNYLTSYANTESNIYPNLKNLLIVQKLLKDNHKI